VVADAVQVEPVSTAKFPANREKNREFRRIRPLGAILKADTRVDSEACSEIPYAAEQGIILAEQGISARDQGILPAGIEIIAERDFRHKRRLAVKSALPPKADIAAMRHSIIIHCANLTHSEHPGCRHLSQSNIVRLNF
jgi:hypothetical protein